MDDPNIANNLNIPNSSNYNMNQTVSNSIFVEETSTLAKGEETILQNPEVLEENVTMIEQEHPENKTQQQSEVIHKEISHEVGGAPTDLFNRENNLNENSNINNNIYNPANDVENFNKKKALGAMLKLKTKREETPLENNEKDIKKKALDINHVESDNFQSGIFTNNIDTNSNNVDINHALEESSNIHNVDATQTNDNKDHSNPQSPKNPSTHNENNEQANRDNLKSKSDNNESQIKNLESQDCSSNPNLPNENNTSSKMEKTHNMPNQIKMIIDLTENPLTIKKNDLVKDSLNQNQSGVNINVNATSVNTNTTQVQEPSHLPQSDTNIRKKITFADAKKEIEEFTQQINSIEEEIKEKFHINLNEFYFDDFLPDDIKMKLIEDYFNSEEFLDLAKKAS
jgi:hypothetical protein